MSSQNEYFSKFPLVAYNNTYAIDILKRVRIQDQFKKYGVSYYSYSMEQGERADTISNAFYSNPYYSWVVYLTNNMVDPLFEWHKDGTTLENYLIGKYGTVDNALSKTAYYRVNQNLSRITKAAYNALSASRKKYWTRAFATPQQEETYWRSDPEGRSYQDFQYYEITKTPLVTETNLVVKVEYTKASGNNTLVVGDIIQKTSGGTLLAKGEVTSLVDGAMYIKHVTDTSYYSSSGSSTNISGTMTVRNKDLTLSVTSANVVSRPIPIDEFAYWQPVSFFDVESELNDSRQLVSLIAAEYVDTIDNNLRELLKV